MIFICIVDLLLHKVILYAWCKIEILLTFNIYFKAMVRVTFNSNTHGLFEVH